jgi:3-oxoacyl-[acyl-carrier protein] reductase
MAFSIAGQKAFITGASSGIGKAIALRFATEGVVCVLAGRNQSRLKTARDELAPPQPKDGSKRSHEMVALDVRIAKEWKNAARTHEDVNILINCAGTTGQSSGALLVRMEEGQIEEVLDTNLQGAVLGCKYFSKQMIARKTGQLSCVLV